MERVETTVEAGPYRLSIVRPPDAAELIDEDAFAENEFLPYWAELWPSGVALARAAAELVTPGERVVELGCGLGVASIAAALSGGEVLATDWSTEALEFTRENAALNGVLLETAHVAWTEADELVARGPWDWVLAADVLYENRNVGPLAALLPRLGDRALIADPGRPAAKTFFDTLGWESRQLDGGVKEVQR
ncbi:MAG TPA: 50S ribosomal protein L11 methyltransferase [Gaiellaceae bacterium]|nr:50S ribosomal protein L11 methyltransferase [Gaiellaceae bacterium]